MLGGASTSSPITTGNVDEVLKPSGAQRKKSKNRNMSNTRRFSDEQIKSLESLFRMESKLEPRKKLEMARQLGLHPRQVAIWFQNRRARWKSKQVEQDYTSLKADYDTLTHRFDSLNKEKHALLQQLRNLCSQLKEPHEGSCGSENGDTNNFEVNGNSSGPLEQDMAILHSDSRKEESEKANKLSEEAHEKTSNYDLGSLFDGTCSNWWDFWSSNS